MRVEHKFRIALGVMLFTSLVIAGCAQSKPQAAPESPAPLQPAGKEFIYNFDNDAVDRMPERFHGALTGGGAAGEWQVKADPSAPSQPNVLAQVSSDSTSSRFPLAIADDGIFKDLELSVRFKPISGKVDQAAGLVFRLKDANNYYIVRANALENNVVLYKVENGKRTDLPVKGEGRTYGKKAEVPSSQWSILKVTAKGNLFEVYLNDRPLYEVEDDTFKDAGKIGLWTKADSITHFDDLRVVAR
ncbi:MAG TPA: family 16 glycoside hydrolase [Blastocatellia bacterium]|nr:family 16 glycoside hydrolase [Blastocatellia bacterium]